MDISREDLIGCFGRLFDPKQERRDCHEETTRVSMKLPNGSRAIVDIVKLRDYCLSLSHPLGRHKAHVFSSALGLTQEHAEEFRQALLKEAIETDVALGACDAYGQRYVIDFELEVRDRVAVVRSAWIVLSGEDLPRFTSCYVLKRGRRQ